MSEKCAFQRKFFNCPLGSLCLDLTSSRCYQRQMTQTDGILCWLCGFSCAVKMGCSLVSSQSHKHHSQEKSQQVLSNYLSCLVLDASFPFETQQCVRNVAQSIVLQVHSQGCFLLLRGGKWLTDPWSLSLPSFVLQRASWASTLRSLQQSW